MCTRARLVQAERASPWSGFHQTAETPGWQRWTLTSGVPATLEVTIDPAAHGPSGVGPIERGVALRTSTGQTIQFSLRATVTA